MENQVILLIVFGTIGIMLMAFALIFFVSLYKRRVLQNQLDLEQIKSRHQQEMLKATLESIEEERSRIGTELHDSVGAMLSTIKLNLQVKDNTDPEMKPILGNLNETIGLVRSISHQMMPVVLKKYGLNEAIQEMISNIKGLEIQCPIWDDNEWSENDALMIFRIIQESIQNSIKHSQGSVVEIKGRKGDSFFEIEISDNGVGFPGELMDQSYGLGLWNIRNRAQALDGIIRFTNKEDGGAVVALTIPLNQPA